MSDIKLPSFDEILAKNAPEEIKVKVHLESLRAKSTTDLVEMLLKEYKNFGIPLNVLYSLVLDYCDKMGMLVPIQKDTINSCLNRMIKKELVEKRKVGDKFYFKLIKSL